VLEFPLHFSSSFTFFFLATSYFFFGFFMLFDLVIRKLKLPSSIAVILQASQTAVVFYQFQVHLLAVLQVFSGYNCLLPFFKFDFWLYFKNSQATILSYQFFKFN
jgi:hypothetical protein